MMNYNDYKDPDTESSYRAIIYALAGMLVGIILAMMLSGCTVTKYVPVETIRTEYKTKTDSFIQKDSIFVKDSVLVESKGDTTKIHHWHTKYVDRWRDVVHIDSFIKRDSIQVPVPVEKKLTRWQQVKIDYGGEAIVSLVIMLFILLWLIVKRRLRC